MMRIESLKSIVTPYPPSVGVVVPTYCEVENIPLLANRLRALREKTGWQINLLFMDDNSKDGSEELVRRRAATCCGDEAREVIGDGQV